MSTILRNLFFCILHSDCFCFSMNYGNLIFKRATVWVYGRPKCNPTTSSGCNARIGYCTCVNGYFGPACEYQCPDGHYGRNCRDACQCMNGALVGYFVVLETCISRLLYWKDASHSTLNQLSYCIAEMHLTVHLIIKLLYWRDASHSTFNN